MNHKLLLALSMAGLGAGAQAEASGGETKTPTSTVASEPAKFKGLQLGGVISHASYREPGLMQVEGLRIGLWTAYDWQTEGPWKLGVQGELHSGALRYTSAISGQLDNVPDHEVDFRVTAFRPLKLATDSTAAWDWGIYGGLGYRLHYNDLRGTTSVGHIGYRRLNQRFYLPMGLKVEHKGPKKFTTSLEFTPVLHGTHTTYMTDVGGTQNATVPQRGRGWALQVGWQPIPGWRLNAYHRHWTTDATRSWSSVINGSTRQYYEPSSQSNETGFRLLRKF